MNLNIYRYKKGLEQVFLTSTNDFSVIGTWMDIKQITSKIISPIPYLFRTYSVNEYDYVVYNNDKYILFYEPTGKNQNTENKYEYDLVFYGEEILLKTVLLRDIVKSGSAINQEVRYNNGNLVEFFGGAKEFALRLQANIDNQMGVNAWKINVDVSTEFGLIEKYFVFDGLNCWDALKAFNQDVNINFYIDTTKTVYGSEGLNILTITDKKQFVIPYTFEQGQDKGLYDITKTESSGTEIVTRLYPQGGDRNIPIGYKQSALPVDKDRYSPFLLLPNNQDGTIRYYYDDIEGIKKFGIRPKSEKFDYLYPSIYDTRLKDLYPEKLVSGFFPTGTIGNDGVSIGGLSGDLRVDGIVGCDPIVENGQQFFNIYTTDLGFFLDKKETAGDEIIKIPLGSDLIAQYPDGFVPPFSPSEPLYAYTPKIIVGKRKIKIPTIKVTTPKGTTGVIELGIWIGSVMHEIKEYIVPNENVNVEKSFYFTSDTEYDIEKDFSIYVNYRSIQVHAKFDGYRYPVTVFLDGLSIDYSVKGAEYYKHYTTSNAIISMRDGRYAGYDFTIQKDGTKKLDITDNYYSNGARYSIKLARFEDSGSLLPSVGAPMAANDRFVIIGINMPDTYVTMAENRLLSATIDYITKNNYLKNSISLNIATGFTIENPDIFRKFVAGNVCKVKDDGIDLSERGLTIENVTVRYSSDTQFPIWSCTLSDVKTYGKFEQLSKDISSSTRTQQSSTALTAETIGEIYKKLSVFDSWFELDEENNAIKAKKGLYTDYFLSSKGLSSVSGGGGGVSYERLDSWSDYTPDKSGYVLSAALGSDLNTRVSSLESGSALSISTTGNGNVVTSVSKSGTVISINKGLTAVLEGDSRLTDSRNAKDVYSWAKDITKPTYTYSEVGAEQAFSKNTAFNKNFGTTAGSVAQGNDSRILNGQTAFGWGNHASVGYALSSTVTSLSNSLNALRGAGLPTTIGYRDVTEIANTLLTFLTGTDTDATINKWKELEAFLEGFTETDTLAKALALKADKAIAFSAGAGLVGGGDLSANRAFSLAASGISDGTYKSVTVDTYGRVTAGTNPTTLAGYGITDGVNSVVVNGSGNAITSATISGHGLTLTKGSTFLDKATFDDLFVKVQVDGVWTIQAKYGLWTDYFLSSKGLSNVTGGGGGATSLGQLTNVGAWADTIAPYDRIMVQLNGSSFWSEKKLSEIVGLDTTALGEYLTTNNYATQLWVNSKNYLLASSYTASDILSKLKTVDGSGSGLDADMLDGLHASSFYSRRGNTNSGTSGAAGWREKLPIITGTYYGHEANIGDIALFNSDACYGQMLIDFFGCWFRHKDYRNATIEGSTFIQLANVNGNVASATKLQNTRTLWGQSFDGTGNVDGNLTTSGNIIASSYINAQRYFTGYDSGVANSMSCANWFRSNGATGWINATYGGGIHMKDSNYVTVYNQKSFLVENTNYSAINNQGGYYSNRNTSNPHSLTNFLNPENAVFNQATTFGVGAETSRNILGWLDQISGVGYLTRYTIGSRRDSTGWGKLVLAIGNNDSGTSGSQLVLDGVGIATWTGVFSADRLYAGYDRGITGGISCSDWFAVGGQGGLLFASYGGGLRMTDSTWIRTYGTKKFYVDNTEIDAINTAGGVWATSNIQSGNSIIASSILKSNAGRLDLGLATLRYDAANKAVYFVMADGTPCGLYTDSFVSSKGLSPNLATAMALRMDDSENELSELRNEVVSLKAETIALKAEIETLKG